MSPLEKLLQETFSDLDNLSAEKLKGLIQEASKFFADLKEKANSSTPSDREEALKAALSLKETLLAQTESLADEFDLNPDALLSLADTPEKISPENMRELTLAKKELEPTTKPHADKKLKKATWLPG